MITSTTSLNVTILDLAGLVPNPPHRTIKSTKCEEGALALILGLVYDCVSTNPKDFTHSAPNPQFNPTNL